MATYSTNEFKSGLKVLVDGEPCSILENEVVKPGKGQAFNRVKFRNLLNGRVWERTYKSGESIEAADVMETDMEYLYSDGEFGRRANTTRSVRAPPEPPDWSREQLQSTQIGKAIFSVFWSPLNHIISSHPRSLFRIIAQNL